MANVTQRAQGLLAAISVLCLLGSSPTIAQRYLVEKEPARHALVISNANYAHLGAIPSAKFDGERITERLEKLGFKTTHIPDLRNPRQLEDEILPAFRSRIERGDLVLFYYSGHGFAYSANNFVAPTEMPLTLQSKDLGDVAVSLENVESYLAKRQPGLLLILIDACRTIAGFIVTSPQNVNMATKGFVSPPSSERSVNTIVGYAARPGLVAFGSNDSTAPSLFTKSLADKISQPDKEFNSVFNQVSSDVKLASNETQQPGIFDWSDADLYLNPTNAILAAQREAWLAALSQNSKDDIKRFLYQFSVSRHAAAARQWLHDIESKEDNLASDSVFASAFPMGFERALSTVESGRANLPSMTQVAFRHSAQGGAVLHAAYALSSDALVLDRPVYLSVAVAHTTTRVVPIELGKLLKEVIALRSPTGVKELVDKTSILAALNELKKAGRSVTGVSLATRQSPDKRLEGIARSQLIHAKYLLKQEGISDSQIRLDPGGANSTGDGVLLRFFGY